MKLAAHCFVNHPHGGQHVLLFTDVEAENKAGGVCVCVWGGCMKIQMMLQN